MFCHKKNCGYSGRACVRHKNVYRWNSENAQHNNTSTKNGFKEIYIYSPKRITETNFTGAREKKTKSWILSLFAFMILRHLRPFFILSCYKKKRKERKSNTIISRYSISSVTHKIQLLPTDLWLFTIFMCILLYVICCFRYFKNYISFWYAHNSNRISEKEWKRYQINGQNCIASLFILWIS